jgi:diaminopimelate decarboxylase
MIYANPAKMRSHLEFASTNGVRMLTFDGEDELYKIAEMNQALPAD